DCPRFDFPVRTRRLAFIRPNNPMQCVSTRYRRRADWFDLQPIQCLDEIIQNTLRVETEVRTETTPQCPTNALQNALSIHVICPTLRPMVLIAIALNSQPPPSVPYHHVD